MENGSRLEEWVNLERTQFVWLSGPAAAFNPTYQPSRTPSGEAALQHKVCGLPSSLPGMQAVLVCSRCCV